MWVTVEVIEQIVASDAAHVSQNRVGSMVHPAHKSGQVVVLASRLNSAVRCSMSLGTIRCHSLRRASRIVATTPVPAASRRNGLRAAMACTDACAAWGQAVGSARRLRVPHAPTPTIPHSLSTSFPLAGPPVRPPPARTNDLVRAPPSSPHVLGRCHPSS